MNIVLGILGISAADSLHRLDPMPQSADSLWSILLRLGFFLALIVGLIWGSIYLMKRMSGKNGKKSGCRIRVVERMFIAPKKAIYIVEIGGRGMALGVTDSHISMLAELPDLPFETEPAEAPKSFLKWMKEL